MATTAHVVITFGRFNPPTIGHEKLIKATAKIAGTDNYFIYTGHTQDKKKNPLESSVKVDYMKRMFKSHAAHIMYDPTLKTLIQILQHLQETHQELTLVVGSDRVSEMETLINKYNGTEYAFRTLTVRSAGERDPDADGAEGMSASKMRAAALAGDAAAFRKGVPSTLTVAETTALMRLVVAGLTK